MSVSQTEGYFENLLALKRNLQEKAFFSVKTKNQLKFCRKVCWKEQSFIFPVYLMNHIFRHLYL